MTDERLRRRGLWKLIDPVIERLFPLWCPTCEMFYSGGVRMRVVNGHYRCPKADH